MTTTPSNGDEFSDAAPSDDELTEAGDELTDGGDTPTDARDELADGDELTDGYELAEVLEEVKTVDRQQQFIVAGGRHPDGGAQRSDTVAALSFGAQERGDSSEELSFDAQEESVDAPLGLAYEDSDEDHTHMVESFSHSSAEHSRVDHQEDFEVDFSERALHDGNFHCISALNDRILALEPLVAFGRASTLAGTGTGVGTGVGLDIEVDGDFEYSDSVDYDLEQNTPAGFGESLGVAWVDCHPQDGPCTLYQRLKLCIATGRVNERFSTDATIKERVAIAIDSAIAGQAALEGLQLYSAERRKAAAQMDEILTALEEQQRLLDDKIPASWLRGPLLERNLDLEKKVYADYFHATVHRATMSPEWWERVTALAVASACTRNEDGSLKMIPESEVALLWDHVLPRSELDSESIGVSVTFFVDATGRLLALEDPQELFTSGLYLDVVGYQVSLRDAFFRPEILYACVSFHVMLANWVNSEEKNRVLRGTLNHEIAGVYSEVRKIFRSQFEDKLLAETLAAKLRGEEEARAAQEAEEDRQRYDPKGDRARAAKRAWWWRRVWIGCAAAIVLLVGIPLASVFFGEHTRDLKEMSAEMVASIHPLLLSASQSEGAGLIVAKVDADRWALLSAEQRARAAAEILKESNQRGLRSLIVFAGEVTVLHITEGELRYAE